MKQKKKFFATIPDSWVIIVMVVVVISYIDKQNKKELLELEIERTKLSIQLLKIQLEKN